MNLNERLSRANWPVFALPTIRAGKELKELRAWLRNNMAGEYFIRSCKETRPNNRQVTIATLVRIRDDGDATIFKLRWAGYE